MAAVPFLWGELDNRTITSNVTFASLTALFTLGRFFDQLQVTAQALSAITPTFQVYGLRASDSKWVPLAPELTLGSGDAASTYVFDIAPGQFSSVAYRVAGNSASGIDIACAARASSEAA